MFTVEVCLNCWLSRLSRSTAKIQFTGFRKPADLNCDFVDKGTFEWDWKWKHISELTTSAISWRHLLIPTTISIRHQAQSVFCSSTTLIARQTASQSRSKSIVWPSPIISRSNLHCRASNAANCLPPLSSRSSNLLITVIIAAPQNATHHFSFIIRRKDDHLPWFSSRRASLVFEASAIKRESRLRLERAKLSSTTAIWSNLSQSKLQSRCAPWQFNNLSSRNRILFALKSDLVISLS